MHVSAAGGNTSAAGLLHSVLLVTNQTSDKMSCHSCLDLIACFISGQCRMWRTQQLNKAHRWVKRPHTENELTFFIAQNVYFLLNQFEQSDRYLTLIHKTPLSLSRCFSHSVQNCYFPAGLCWENSDVAMDTWKRVRHSKFFRCLMGSV